jgi:hypothetical protein
MRIRRVGTWASHVRLDSPQDEEWVHAAVIDELLTLGFPTTAIRYEHWLTAESRCDVTVEVPEAVLVIECKRLPRFANSTAAIQVRRYKDAAYPGRAVHGYLVWPVSNESGLRWQEIA